MKTIADEPINTTIGWEYQEHSGKYAQVTDEIGLTKREYFAGLAMQGMLCYVNKPMPPDAIAQEALRIADALITELNK